MTTHACAAPHEGAARFFSISRLLLPFLALLLPHALGGSWELVACADRDNLPYSDVAGNGFENRIMEVIAGELGAELRYAFMPENHRETDAQLMLRHGECDVVPSILDGQEPFLSTVSYYTATSYFVTRQDGPVIESLDDERLPDLSVGVDRSSPVDFALISRMEVGRLRHYERSDAPEAMLEDLLAGELDVAIMRGAVAGYLISSGSLPLALRPVTPEIDIPFLALAQPMTMGVRRGDSELRDLLSRAIDRRSADIQEILDELHVARRQQTPSSPPALPADSAEVRVGMVLPVRTGSSALFHDNIEALSSAAVRGAQLAAERSGRDGQAVIRLLQAAAPDAATAARSAARMIEADGTVAIIGGVGPGQAAGLADVAEAHSVPYLNIAEPDPALREGGRSVFNVAPGYDAYISAVRQRLDDTAAPRVFLVVGNSGKLGRAAAAVGSCLPAGWLAGSFLTGADMTFYGPAFSAIEDSGATHVLLLLGADEQLVFTAQYTASGVPAELLAIPGPGSQLRQYYWSLQRDAGDTPPGLVLAPWDSAIPDSEFNEAYRSRWGEQPEAIAWTAYQAVRIVALAAADDGAGASGLAELLGGGEFDLLDGLTAGFTGERNQLDVPLWALRLQAMPEGATFPLAQLTGVEERVEGGSCF